MNTSTNDHLRILLVEDNPALARLLNDVLEALNFVVIGPFATQETALAAASASDFDIALLDVHLKDGTSFPVAETLLRAGKAFGFQTASLDEVRKSPYGDRPALQKPFKLIELAKFVEEVANPRAELVH